ncbi:hypothetical protein ACFFRR_002436 [Megaselia abdita]
MLRIVVVLLCIGSAVRGGILGSSSIKCGASTSSKSFSLVNPSNPPNNCVYTVKPSSSKVCQIRLDFDEMTLAPPRSFNFTQCVDDYLEVGGYRFCGRESGQHIYIPFTGKSLPIRIVSTYRSLGSQLPWLSWRIQVRQLECPKGLLTKGVSENYASISDNELLAPSGCLQYFLGTFGRIQSFNFDQGRGTLNDNLTYAVCIRRTSETQGVRLFGENVQLGCDRVFRGDDFLLVPFGGFEGTFANSSMVWGSSLQNKSHVSKIPGPISLVAVIGNNRDRCFNRFSVRYELF